MANTLTKDDLIHKVIQQTLLDPKSGQNKTSADGLLHYIKKAGITSITKGDIIKHAKKMAGVSVQGGNLIVDVAENLESQGSGVSNNMIANYNHFDAGQTEDWEDDYEGTNEAKMTASKMVKVFKNKADWGDFGDHVYVKSGNLVVIDTFYYGEAKAIEDLTKSWIPGGSNYVYFRKKYGINMVIVDTFSEFSAIGRHKKLTNDGIVGLVLKISGGQDTPLTETTMKEGPNKHQAHLSSADYQKVKKLKWFDEKNYKWNPKSQLYDKVNEMNEVFNGTPNKNDGADILRWIKSSGMEKGIKSGKYKAGDIAKGMSDDVGRPVKPEWVKGALKLVGVSLKESVNEADAKAEAEETLQRMKDKLKFAQGKRSNAMHPFDPQKKMKDYVNQLKNYNIPYWEKEVAKLSESVNESVNEEYELNEAAGMGTMVALAIALGLGVRLSLMPESKLQQILGTTIALGRSAWQSIKDFGHSVKRGLPIIGPKIKKREADAKAYKDNVIRIDKLKTDIQSYIANNMSDEDIIKIFKSNEEFKYILAQVAKGKRVDNTSFYNAVKKMLSGKSTKGSTPEPIKKLMKKIKADLSMLESVEFEMMGSINEVSKKEVTTIANGLSKVAEEMKKHAALFVKSKAKGDAKEMKQHIGHLKKLTSQKKELESGLDKAINGLEKDVELVANEHVVRSQIRNIVRESLAKESKSLEEATHPLMKKFNQQLMNAAKVAVQLYTAGQADPNAWSGTEGNDAAQYLRYVWNSFSTGKGTNKENEDEIFK